MQVDRLVPAEFIILDTITIQAGVLVHISLSLGNINIFELFLGRWQPFRNTVTTTGVFHTSFEP